MIPVVHGACIYGSLAAREHRLGHAQSTNDLRMHAVHQSVPPKSSSHLALPIPSSRAQEARAAGSEPKVSPTYAPYPSGALYPRCPQRRRPFDVARVSPALEYYANAPGDPTLSPRPDHPAMLHCLQPRPASPWDRITQVRRSWSCSSDASSSLCRPRPRG